MKEANHNFEHYFAICIKQNYNSKPRGEKMCKSPFTCTSKSDTHTHTLMGEQPTSRVKKLANNNARSGIIILFGGKLKHFFRLCSQFVIEDFRALCEVSRV